MAAAKRVVLVAYHFPPENTAGAARPYRFYKYLPAAGYQRSVFTAAEAGPSPMEDVVSVADPLGAYWDGHGDRPPGKFDYTAELLVRKYVLRAAKGVIWSRDVARAFRAFARQHSNEKLTVISTFPPAGALLAALQMARVPGVRIVADYRDPFSLTPRLATSGAKRVDRWTFRRADLVIANNDVAAEAYRARFPWAAAKIHTIWNGFDPEEDGGARTIPERPYRVLAHAGSIYTGRSPDAILQSIARLRAAGDAAACPIKVELVGPLGAGAVIDKALMQQAESEGWITFVPRQVPKAEAQRVTGEADFLLLLQPQSSVQVPAKLFEYIRVGRPILAYAPRASAIERLLEGAATPFCCVYPDDPPQEIDGKLSRFFELPPGPYAASDWFLDQFDARRQTRHLVELIDGLP